MVLGLERQFDRRLSTAVFLTPADAAARLLRGGGGTSARLHFADGSTRTVRA
jgi:hypothetical protein